MFEAERGDDFVPVGGIAQDCGGDPSAARSSEEPGVRVGACGEDAFGDEGPDVDESAGRGGGLPAYGPDPVGGADVGAADREPISRVERPLLG
ncbi:hypothetical protein ACFRI7_20160 [Streptomyces sp. NPDC056716]|uniref:hypothetical protein n=1 Tax=unclassified Streptomyces TaxID=2593676 RepID=UPI0036901111